MTETRQIVVPGETVATSDEFLPGQNTYLEGREIRALRLGVKSVRGDRVNVISLNGRYEPFRGDAVIGTVVELGPSNWYINVGAANDVGMHVNDVPWRVEFGETSKYLDIGDTVLLKIVHVDEMKKAQVSMKDRQCRKLTGGLIWEVSPSKVPRIVGRNGSMIGLIKDYTSVRLFVGQNGVVWLDGEPADVNLALEALHKIEAEAHTSGLTDRMKAWLESRRPGAADRKRAIEEEERAGEEEFRPAERRPRPKIERSDEEEEEGDRPPSQREERGGMRERGGGGFRGERERGGGGGGFRGERERGGGGGGFRGERERGGGGGFRGERERGGGGGGGFRGERERSGGGGGFGGERGGGGGFRAERAPGERERPAPRDERPRRFREDAEEEERPARRAPVDDEEERPARRLRDEVERPMRRAREDDAEGADEPPARRPRVASDDDEEDAPPRRAFREGGGGERREGRFGGARSGSEGGGGGHGGGRRRGGRGRGRGGRGGRED